VTGLGPFDANLVLSLQPGTLLWAFNRAGVLAPADVHVASALCRLSGEGDELVKLACALVVRAPRAGHVHVDLSAVRSTVVASPAAEAEGEASRDEALDELPWPEPEDWLARLENSVLVSTPAAKRAGSPLWLEGSALYLERYWRDERAVAKELLRRAAAPPVELDSVRSSELLDRLFADDASGLQRSAAAQAAKRLLCVIAGGPGTGKTTTVARLLALVYDQRAAQGAPPPAVALTAPTGKAAARMAEAVHEEAGHLPLTQDLREWLAGLEASTVDRLLGRQPGSARFRYGSHNRLHHDLVVVDETSMMSLPLMANLLQAVRPDAHLALVGDPEQLASVEAGAVLADIVGPSDPACRAKARSGGLSSCLTVLQANHRFSGALAQLAVATRAGDADAVMTVLRHSEAEAGETLQAVRWLDIDPSSASPEALAAVLSIAGSAAESLAEASSAGKTALALEALSRFRLLCAHREGPDGASTWNARIEQYLQTTGAVSASASGWYAGRPVVVTENDYSLGLFNGDLGVAVAAGGGRLEVAFLKGATAVPVSPSRLASVQTAYAMTAHRAQGSEFDEVVFVMPAAGARILTRELFYTAITRARRRVTVVGTEEAVRAAVARPVARASGLAARLWGVGDPAGDQHGAGGDGAPALARSRGVGDPAGNQHGAGGDGGPALARSRGVGDPAGNQHAAGQSWSG
jgi:exodeoxyribonuclease V alpha subunit